MKNGESNMDGVWSVPMHEQILAEVKAGEDNISTIGRTLGTDYQHIMETVKNTPELFCYKHYCGGTIVRLLKKNGQPYAGFEVGFAVTTPKG
jgi:hypothetical protein